MARNGVPPTSSLLATILIGICGRLALYAVEKLICYLDTLLCKEEASTGIVEAHNGNSGTELGGC